MFKFGNFSKNVEEESEESANEEYIPSKQVEWSNENINFDLVGESYHLIVKDIDILYFDQKCVLSNLRDIDPNINEAERGHSDLIPGRYEGGLKIWECTYDLANYLCTHMKNNFKEKLVLDLGCGLGILGILAFKLGASQVHFQDYNEGVIKFLSIPHVVINNGERLLKCCKFWSGDWKSFSEINPTKYDIILTSETIYNPKNHEKLLMALKSFLKPDGIIVLGAKSCYFGVGGSVSQFLQRVSKDNTFSFENVWKSEEGITREIILIKRKT